MMRRPGELLARFVGIGALLLALVIALRGPSPSRAGATRMLSRGALADSSARRAVEELAALVMRAPEDSAWPSLHLTALGIPDGSLRTVLAGARAAGMALSWTDSTEASGLAVAASSVADPQGGTIIRAVSGSQRPLVVGDAASVLDSIDDAAPGLTVRAGRLAGGVVATQGTSRATIGVPRMGPVRRVLLAARPGWEAKFISAALEERGWTVDGTLLIARRASVVIGAPMLLDTAHYAAVIVLDSGVVTADMLMRYARQGGGIVLAGAALASPSMAALRPASIIGRRPAVPGALLTDAPRQGLDAFTLRPSDGAVVLQSDGRGARREPSVIARRVGAGRVIASGYVETWRWRMEGTDDGLDAHRRWWSGLVSAVAFVPADTSAAGDTTTTRYPGPAAPYADFVARVGAPSVALSPPSMVPVNAPSRVWLLFVVASAALLVEWALRRLRGAP